MREVNPRIRRIVHQTVGPALRADRRDKNLLPGSFQSALANIEGRERRWDQARPRVQYAPNHSTYVVSPVPRKKANE